MFTGIVEAQSEIVEVLKGSHSLHLTLQKPSHFADLKLGDSIAVNGVCLTLDHLDTSHMKFTLAAETLHITGWNKQILLEQGPVNVERSMLATDRVHGHFVLGHVDGMARVLDKRDAGEALILKVEIPSNFLQFVWRKGSLTLNGVSLTINKVENQILELCLIPETLKRTNLDRIQLGDKITFEVDAVSRAFVHLWNMEKHHV